MGLRPERPDHVWCYDFLEDRTHDGRKFRMLNVIDEVTRECLAIRIGRRLSSADIVDVLSDLFILRCAPGQSARATDNSPEYAGRLLDQWIYRNGVEFDFSRPGMSTNNAFIATFNARLRAECLNASWFMSLADARDRIDA